jgi:methylthioribulose-1-phosphate dehydratase
LPREEKSLKPKSGNKNPLTALVACGKQFYERRWMCGTAGNLSVRTGSDPWSFAITPSGLNKGHLSSRDLLKVSEKGSGKTHPRGLVPSAETAIHQMLYQTLPSCGAVFHVHPMHATLISSLYGDPKQPAKLRIGWFEMMKGVGVGEEEESDLIILPNWQDVTLIAHDLQAYLKNAGTKTLPAVLIYNHGLTAWGATADQTRNHLEIIEYVCEYLLWKHLVGSSGLKR